MKKWLHGAGIGTVLTGIVWLTGCAGGTYAEGTYYDYDYYPDYDVYYYPQANIYYWNEEGRWRHGGDLPPRIDLHEHQHERLHLRSQEPWTERHMEHHEEHHDHHDRDHD